MRRVAVCSVRPFVRGFSFLELDFPGYCGLNCKNVKVRFVAIAQISEIRREIYLSHLFSMRLNISVRAN